MSDELENEAVQANAIIEWMLAALRGERVSDFAESFGPVREAMDVRAELDGIEAAESDAWNRVALQTQAELDHCRETLRQLARGVGTGRCTCNHKRNVLSEREPWTREHFSKERAP